MTETKDELRKQRDVARAERDAAVKCLKKVLSDVDALLEEPDDNGETDTP